MLLVAVLLMAVGCRKVQPRPGTARIVQGPAFTNGVQVILKLDRGSLFCELHQVRVAVQYQTIPPQFEMR
jgi:hypothetical protein